MDYKNSIVTIASNWWTEVIKDAKLDSGATGYEGAMSTILGNMLKEQISDTKQLKFKNLLREYIIKNYEENFIKSNGTRSIILSCDYGPDANLAKIAEQCSISENNFPWKTTMWIGPDYIQVKYGYSSRNRNII